MSDGRLVRAFLGALPPARQAEMASAGELEARLADALAEARADVPEVALDDVTFVEYVASRLRGDGPVAAALREVCAGDLYLACACSRGDAKAVALFEARVVPGIVAVLRRRGASPDLAAEIVQTLRASLFAARGERPAEILDYLGRGSLMGWVRVMAVRRLQHAQKGERRRAGDEALVEAIARAPSLTIDPDRPQHRAVLTEALAAGLGLLTARQRNLLRLQLVDGLSVRELAAMYAVHHATVARWIADARDLLASSVRDALLDKLAVGRGEVDSLVRAVQSQIDLSLERLL